MFDPTFFFCCCWSAPEQKSWARQPHDDCLFWLRSHRASIPNDAAAVCGACMCCPRSRWQKPTTASLSEWLAQHFSTFHPLPFALWEFSPSQKIRNVHEHPPPLCLLARVCMCCQVLSSARILFVHEGSLLGRVCVHVHVGGREQYLRRRKPACCLLVKIFRGKPWSVACRDKDGGILSNT